MKKLFLSAAAAAALLAADLRPAEAATSVVRRTTLLVADIERSVDFYERIGFRVWLDREGPRDPETGELPLNGKPKHSRIVVMAGQNDAVAMVGLLQYDKPALAPTRNRNGKIGVTDIVLVIQTDDLATVYESLLEIDADVVSAPQPYSVESVEVRKNGLIMFVADPDGHVIELTQVVSTTPLEPADK